MLEIKYPNPKNHPIWKAINFLLLKLLIKKISNKGNVTKLIITKLYGGRLKEVIKPKIKGTI